MLVFEIILVIVAVILMCSIIIYINNFNRDYRLYVYMTHTTGRYFCEISCKEFWKMIDEYVTKNDNPLSAVTGKSYIWLHKDGKDKKASNSCDFYLHGIKIQNGCVLLGRYGYFTYRRWFHRVTGISNKRLANLYDEYHRSDLFTSDKYTHDSILDGIDLSSPFGSLFS